MIGSRNGNNSSYWDNKLKFEPIMACSKKYIVKTHIYEK